MERPTPKQQTLQAGSEFASTGAATEYHCSSSELAAALAALPRNEATRVPIWQQLRGDGAARSNLRPASSPAGPAHELRDDASSKRALPLAAFARTFAFLLFVFFSFWLFLCFLLFFFHFFFFFFHFCLPSTVMRVFRAPRCHVAHGGVSVQPTLSISPRRAPAVC